MLRRHCLVLLAFAATAPLAASDHHGEVEKSRVAIVTGQNNHSWFVVAPTLAKVLEGSGLFDVDVVQTPSAKDPASAWDDFAIAFDDYAVIVSVYNDSFPRTPPEKTWPPRIRAAFERYIESGGKAYLHHAANNAFMGWDEFERMAGLLWRRPNQGKRLYLDDGGRVVKVPVGQGPGAGHGPQWSYLVEHRVPDHPVFAGLPSSWRHTTDELYHGQRGPAEDMTVLATAYAPKERRGTGVHEPLIWTVPYGKGLVMTNVMGHYMTRQPGGPVSLQCSGWQTVFVRSIEWLATGGVTTDVPGDFPGTGEAVDRGPIAIEPLPQ